VPPAATPTTAEIVASDQTPAPAATRTNKADGALYAYIPAGKFSMGSTRQNDEKPLHVVDINAFWIMQTEVTNAEYARCVGDGTCTPPHNSLANNPEEADHPVVNVDWMQASAYAKWAGGRLPSEAEWEKAARGSDLRPFPWGANTPEATLLNFNSTLSDTTPVMNYPLGVSPYGLYDMAGNVEEWVADWYANDYYAASPAENPPGPTEGIFRVVRGGSYHSDATLVQTTSRGKAAPIRGYATVGFRVVQDK
jgi:formylglycine-generating enzyme required for sulfatase activity